MRMFAIILVSFCVCSHASNIHAQKNDIRSMIGGLRGNRLLKDELEITEEQRKALLNILVESPENITELKELIAQVREQGKAQGLTELQIQDRLLNERDKHYWSKIEDILLEKQVTRLKQLERRYNPFVTYEFQTLLAHSQELGLTKQQEARIRGIIEPFLVEHEKEIKDLESDIYSRLVSQLPAPIREPYLDLVGERFDFDKMEKEKTANVAKQITAISEAHKTEKTVEVPSDPKNPADKE